MKTVSSEKNRIKLDIIAACFFVTFGLLFVYRILHGFGVPDESFYLTIPYRLMGGDRMFLEEWHVSQLSSVLLYLPFRVYYSVAGSTEGVILFFRCLFMLSQLTCGIFLYTRLREYGFTGLIAAAAFCINVPMTISALSYYTMSNIAFLLVACLLFEKKEISGKRSLAAGFLYACGVLAEPLTVLLFPLYCVCVLFCVRKNSRKKQVFCSHGQLLNKRVFLKFTIGAVGCFLIFFLFFISHTDPAAIIKNLPNLFTDSEYSFSLTDGNIFDFSKIPAAFAVYGTWPLIGLCVLFVVSVFVSVKRNTDKKNICAFCFFAALFFFAIAEIFYIVNLIERKSYNQIIYNFGIPVFLFGCICFFLTSKKDPRIGSVLIFGAMISLCVDISSCLVLCYGSHFANVAAVFSVSAFCSEYRAGKKKRMKKKQIPFRVFAAVFTVIHFSVCAVLFLQTVISPPLEKYLAVSEEDIGKNVQCSERITKGPYKGIYTSEKIKNCYSASLEDIDSAGKGSLYVTELIPWLYLYSDAGCSAYSAWYVESDSYGRQETYWNSFSEKNPDLIYIPYFNAFNFNTGFAETTEGKNWLEEKESFYLAFPSATGCSGNAGYVIRLKDTPEF